jgi:DNA polymerase III subunit epsilon
VIRKLLAQLKRVAVTLNAEQQNRLALIKQKVSAKCNVNLGSDRIVVVDVETSGLSLADDYLIAIGAIGIHAGRIVYADSFDVLLRQEVASDRANILIHGIGGTAQRSGLPPEEALLSFLEYLDGAPLIAFHATFDETMLRKAYQKFTGLDFRHSWVDLAYLLPEIFPQYAKKNQALDDWLKQFSIGTDARHNALADALATAQLGLMALRGARAKGIVNFKSLQQMEKAQRWLSAARY